MKRLKRIMALVIAITMVLSMGAMTAFAEQVNNKEITVTANVTVPAAGTASLNGTDFTFTDTVRTTSTSFSISVSYDTDDTDLDSILKRTIKKLCASKFSMNGYVPFITVGAYDLTAATATISVDFIEAPGSITINSPIMGAQYYAYQVFKMTMDNNTNPTAFAYYIGKDDPFYKAVAAYASDDSKGLTLTGVPSTAITEEPYFTEFTVTVDLDKFDAQDFGKALQGKMASTYTGDDKIADPIKIEYTPAYEDGAEVVTPNKAAAITFEKLPYGYYLITNNYDVTTDPLEVSLKIGDSVHKFTSKDYEFTYDSEGNVTDVTVKGLATPDATADPPQEKSYAQQAAEAKYPDLAAAKTQYEADHKGDNTVKTWVSMTEDEQKSILGQYQTTAANNAIAQVKNQILTHTSDDNATDGTTKARLVFIDSTTPNGVINEKNEYEKWDVPVNPQGYADASDTPNHDEPKGGKNIVVGESTDGKTVYADSSEAAIGDKIHYQLSINAVNFERTNANDPDSVKQIKEYVIADYQNKNMKYVPKNGDDYGLKVTIVKKDADGNNEATVAGPMDYSSWVEKGHFFTNKNSADLTADGNVFAEGTGGIVIPWVKKVEKNSGESDDDFLARIASMNNVYKNSVYKKADNDDGITAAAYAALTDANKAETYFLGLDNEGKEKYYKKVPVYAEVVTTDGSVPVTGRKYTQLYGDNTEYNWIAEGTGSNVKYYLVDAGNNKIQAIDKTGEKIWDCDTVYFQSKYENDVTILVDYWMELLDTAVIDGDGNKNTSQFGVNYVESYDSTYEFGTKEKPGENPPDEDKPQQPSEEKDKDDATVYTYAIALKKVDPEGKALVGAKFKLRGVTTTEKNKGWYKVAAYSHASDAAFGTELETDDEGILIIEGLPTKWDVIAMETEAPTGYNKLTETIVIKPFKTGSVVTTTSTVTYKNDNGQDVGKKSVDSTTIAYKDTSDNVIAKSVTIGEKVTYYKVVNGNETKLTDIDGGDSAKTQFEALIAAYTTVDKTNVTMPTNDQITKVNVINNKGAELPSTGGIGTTIFYVVGAILVIGAGVVLITRRRMDS